MIIRKKFKFESAHIVREAVSERCKFSIHGHSYVVEVALHGKTQQPGGMLLDFIEFKNNGIKDFIDNFDHATVVWCKDSDEYKQAILDHSKRIVSMELNPTAENMAMFFHFYIQTILNLNPKLEYVKVKWVRVHETDTGYAESEESDFENMPSEYFGYSVMK